jgi:putative transcriptional regulator
MDSLKDHLLVASPKLFDPNFARSLVLLVEHNDEGAFGVVVNHPVDKTVQELWREVGSEPCNSRLPIYLGGPVPGPLLAVHNRPAMAEVESAPGVFIAARKQHLDQLVLDEKPSYKILIGHSGWSSGQLELEIQQGAWYSVPATAELVFSIADDLWEAVYKEIGSSMIQSVLNAKNLPPDPSVN